VPFKSHTYERELDNTRANSSKDNMCMYVCLVCENVCLLNHIHMKENYTMRARIPTKTICVCMYVLHVRMCAL